MLSKEIKMPSLEELIRVLLPILPEADSGHGRVGASAFCI
jgi:hypothetical protein